MKQTGIRLLIVLAVVWLVGWACGRGSAPGVQNINLSVVSQTLYGGRADKLIPVRQDERVAIHITGDEPMEVFLHGYNVETRVKPGDTSTLEFTANVPGRFPLMIHSLAEGEDKQRVEILLGLVDVLPRR